MTRSGTRREFLGSVPALSVGLSGANASQAARAAERRHLAGAVNATGLTKTDPFSNVQ